MTYDVIKGHRPLMTSVDLGKITMSVLTVDVASQHLSMSISPAKIPKFASFRRWNATELKFCLIWPWKSGHRSKVIVGRASHFQGRCKIVQRLGIPSFVSYSRKTRGGGGCIIPLCRRGLTRRYLPLQWHKLLSLISDSSLVHEMPLYLWFDQSRSWWSWPRFVG